MGLDDLHVDLTGVAIIRTSSPLPSTAAICAPRTSGEAPSMCSTQPSSWWARCGFGGGKQPSRSDMTMHESRPQISLCRSPDFRRVPLPTTSKHFSKSSPVRRPIVACECICCRLILPAEISRDPARESKKPGRNTTGASDEIRAGETQDA